jgi:hypothetical protein
MGAIRCIAGCRGSPESDDDDLVVVCVLRCDISKEQEEEDDIWIKRDGG